MIGSMNIRTINNCLDLKVLHEKVRKSQQQKSQEKSYAR